MYMPIKPIGIELGLFADKGVYQNGQFGHFDGQNGQKSGQFYGEHNWKQNGLCLYSISKGIKTRVQLN